MKLSEQFQKIIEPFNLYKDYFGWLSLQPLAQQQLTYGCEDNMDPVNKKELKGTHAQRKDKDINNDGKVDNTDKYLHRRRKAISKTKGETATMNPKLDSGKDKGSEMEQKESTIRDKLIAVLEGDRAAHYKGAAEAEPMDNNLKGAGAKKMKADIQGNAADPDLEKKSHDDAAKAGRAGPSRKMRSNDNPKGDSKIINPPSDETKKGKGSSEVKESRDTLAGIKAAYRSMYEKKDVEEKLTPQQKIARDAGRGKDKAATDYVKARMKSGSSGPKDSDLDRRMHKGAPQADTHFGGGGRGSHDTSAKPKDKLANQPDIKTRLKNKKAMVAFKSAVKRSQSPSGRSGMGGPGIRS